MTSVMKERYKILYKHKIGKFDTIWRVRKDLHEEILGERRRTLLENRTTFVKAVW